MTNKNIITKAAAIKKLKKTYDNYSVQLDAASTGNATTQGAKVVIQILSKKEDGTPFVSRFTQAYGSGATLDEAQDNAVINAVANLGL